MIEIIDYNMDYKRIWQVIKEVGQQGELTDILEIGCGGGRFEKFLRQHGFNAFGLDFNSDLDKEGIEEGYLFRLNAHYIGKHFGDRLFDVIFTNGVMNEGATIKIIMDQPGGILLGFQNLVEFNRECTLTNIEKILKSGFDQLKPGGFFLAHEHMNNPDDILCFDEILANQLGYSVVRYTPKEAVLKKPLN